MPGSHRRLMVVDDAEESRKTIAHFFQARGYEVTVAPDGVEAVAQAVKLGVDVIIMNALLPGLQGYEAAAILRRLSPRVQILLTMAGEGESEARESRQAERFRCFPLPLDLEEIAGAIEGAGG